MPEASPVPNILQVEHATPTQMSMVFLQLTFFVALNIYLRLIGDNLNISFTLYCVYLQKYRWFTRTSLSNIYKFDVTYLQVTNLDLICPKRMSRPFEALVYLTESPPTATPSHAKSFFWVRRLFFFFFFHFKISLRILPLLCFWQMFFICKSHFLGHSFCSFRGPFSTQSFIAVFTSSTSYRVFYLSKKNQQNKTNLPQVEN
jgi:hypothetical protein